MDFFTPWLHMPLLNADDMSRRTKQRMPSVFSVPSASCLETTSRFISRCLASSTRIHIMALDGIVNVNSLFTVALFLGLSASPAGGQLPGLRASCRPGAALAEGLVTFHVYSFSCFLFSSLVALALKQAIKISSAAAEEQQEGGDDYCGDGGDEAHGRAAMGHMNTVAFRVGMAASALGSAAGSGFLTMALVNLVQMKLGTLGCGESGYSVAAIVPLVVLVPLGLVAYLSLAIYAFTR